MFRFPQEGGTGAIWKKVAALLPPKQQRYNSTITSMDADAKIVVLADGSKIKYQKLLTTIPLDITLTWLGRHDLAKRLTYSSSHIIGLGLRGENPHDHKCWMYYPVRASHHSSLIRPIATHHSPLASHQSPITNHLSPLPTSLVSHHTLCTALPLSIPSCLGCSPQHSLLKSFQPTISHHSSTATHRRTTAPSTAAPSSPTTQRRTAPRTPPSSPPSGWATPPCPSLPTLLGPSRDRTGRSCLRSVSRASSP